MFKYRLFCSVTKEYYNVAADTKKRAREILAVRLGVPLRTIEFA